MIDNLERRVSRQISLDTELCDNHLKGSLLPVKCGQDCNLHLTNKALETFLPNLGSNALQVDQEPDHILIMPPTAIRVWQAEWLRLPRP